MRLVKASHNFGPKQYAHIRESIEYQNVVSNTIYNNGFCLAEFERANKLALNFKFYKPARVTWTYEPMYNTFQAQAAGGGPPGIPYLYVAMNRTQDGQLSGQASPSNLLAQGAKPKKLAKVIKISYIPNWNSPGLITQNIQAAPGIAGGVVQNICQIGQKAEYGFLPCPNLQTRFDTNTAQGINTTQYFPNFANTGGSITGFGGIGNNQASMVTNAVVFNGHYSIIEQINRGALVVCKITCTVDWVFKEPNYISGSPSSDIIFIDSSGNQTSGDPLVNE